MAMSVMGGLSLFNSSSSQWTSYAEFFIANGITEDHQKVSILLSGQSDV